MALRSSLCSLFNVRPGEGRPLVYLLLHSLFLGFILVFLETAASALFLSTFGVTMLPYAYLGTAVVVTTVGFGYAKLQNHLTFRSLLLTNLAILLVSVAALWGALSLTDSQWPCFVLFIWVEVASILISLGQWGLAGRLFHMRQGKRLFGLIGTGGITAGIIGGFSVPLLVQWVGTINLLLFSLVGVILSVLTLSGILHAFRENLAPVEEEEQLPHHGRGWSRLINDRYLVLICLMAGMSMFGYYFVDFIFYGQVEAKYTDDVELASFFGLFFAVVGMIKLVLQTFASGRLINRFGLSFGLLALPAILLVGTSSIAVAGAVAGLAMLFFFAVATKLGDDITRGCIEEPSVFILYQPLPTEDRIRVQTVVEGMVEPVAGGLAAGCLLFLTHVLGFDTIRLACTLVGILVAWTLVTIVLRRQYTRVLTDALAKRSLKDGNLSFADASSIAILKRGLDSRHSGEILYCLNMLEQIQHPSLEDFVIELLDHPAQTVRGEALRRLERWGRPETTDVVAKRLETEPSAALRGSVLQTLCALGESDAFGRVYPYLDDDDPLVRKGAIVGLLRSAGIEGVLAAGEHLTSLVKSENPDDRQLAANVLGEVGIRSFYQPLVQLLQDPDLSVRRAAVVASGQLGNPRLWPLVIENLSLFEVRRAAVVALVAGGESALSDLESTFATTSRSPESQCRIAMLCGRIGGHRVTRWLFGQIDYPNKVVRHHILQALSTCRFQANKVDGKKIREMIDAEVADAVRTLVSMLDIGEHESSAFLSQTLRNELAENRKRIFLLLSFIYSARSILSARDNYMYRSAEKRAHALEVIDNIVVQELKELLLPLLDDLPPAHCVQRLSGRFLQKRLTRNERLTEIVMRPWDSTSAWTQATALFMIGQVGIHDCVDCVTAALASPTALVRETAVWTLASLNPPYLAERLGDLMKDEAPQVTKITKFVLRTRGLFGPRAGRRHLTRSGSLETDLFASVLLDPHEHRANRCRAAHALAFLDPDVAYAALVEGLQIPDETIRSAILDAMRIGRFPDSNDTREQLTSILNSEIEDVERTLKMISAIGRRDDLAQLRGALCSEIDLNRRRILSILDLLGEKKAFDTLYFWYIQQEASSPPNKAVQLLASMVERVGNGTQQQRFLALFELRDPAELAKAWTVADSQELENFHHILGEVAFGEARWIRPWTRVCALDRIVALKLKEFTTDVIQALEDADAIVREMATAVLFQLDREGFDKKVAVLERDQCPAVSRLVRHLASEAQVHFDDDQQRSSVDATYH